MAAIIASQAVITGAFSMTQQAVQLGLLPRIDIRRTSETQAGQIYVPQVNTYLMIGVLVLHEPFDRNRAIGFAFIWIALALYAADGLLRARRSRLATA